MLAGKECSRANTNQHPRRKGVYLGERVYDRLREDGGEVVIFDWQSYRGAA